MKRVINTTGFQAFEGAADQITLQSGNLLYCHPDLFNDDYIKAHRLKIKRVHFFGACQACTINGNAHRGYPIQIDDVSVADFIEKIASHAEYVDFMSLTKKERVKAR